MNITDYEHTIWLLDDIEFGNMPDTESALTQAITVYRELGIMTKTIEAQQARAKKLVTEIMQETGQVKAQTSAGTAAFAADSVRISYDAKALDAICASSDDLNRIIAPHRKETTVKGSLTIK